MKRKMGLLSFLGLSAIIGGCGFFSTKNTGQKQRQNDIYLAGAWNSECKSMDWVGLTSQKETIKFSALGDFERTTQVYTDSTCSSLGAEITSTGTFDTLGASSVVSGSDDINLTVTSATATTRNDTAKDALNAVNFCANSAWVNGEKVNVLDRNCIGTWKKGSVVFDIYRLDNSNKKLNFGRHSFFQDKKDAASRPDVLDTSMSLTLT